MKLKLLFIAFCGLAVAQHDPNTANNRQVIVHLFEWKWDDIAQECENFLGPYGFAGVQISPPYEHAVITNPFRPWWERYQPVSYQLTSRSGNDAQFRDMVTRCNNVGVRIYADAVINHMAMESGTGSAGSPFTDYDFQVVPFGSTDFNVPNGKCNSASGNIQHYGDINQVRNCNLNGLYDLDLSKDYVRGKIMDYMNYMIDIGVAGFRVDAAKHMWPGDLGVVFKELHNLNTDYFPAGSRPFIFQEVIDQGGEPITAGEYVGFGRVTEFKYGLELGKAFRSGNLLKWYKNFGEAWGFLSSGNSVVFVDNHDNQRGHGGGGGIITHEDPASYKKANAFMLAWDYGLTRVMSSFYFHHGDDGPPSDDNGNTKSPSFGADGACDSNSGWVCEHRWQQIRNMVGFRNAAAGQRLSNWWDNGGNQIAFSRGDKAFFALNNERYALTQTLQTGLPSGEYCDVIHGDFNSSSAKCSGPTINVNSNGMASFSINNGEDSMVAIHVNARVGEGEVQAFHTYQTGQTESQPLQSSGSTRTVVFIKKATQSGQDLFTLGGIDHNRRSGCTSDAHTSACAIPIQNRIGGTNVKFNDWSSGDNYLDWYGAEDGQGSSTGTTASGTPLVWTTNDPSYPYNVETHGFGYTPLNKWGEHYWMIDVDMSCDDAESGWFEVKAYVTNGDGWESNRNQASTCGGTAGGSRPYASGNHMGRCGYVNAFEFNSNTCTIDNF